MSVQAHFLTQAEERKLNAEFAERELRWQANYRPVDFPKHEHEPKPRLTIPNPLPVLYLWMVGAGIFAAVYYVIKYADQIDRWAK